MEQVIPYFVNANGLPLSDVDYSPPRKEDGSIDLIDMRELARVAELEARKQSTNAQRK